MSSRLYTALEDTELSGKYKSRFKYQRMNDEQVSFCIQNPEDNRLASLFVTDEDYHTFVDAYCNPLKYQAQTLDSYLNPSTQSQSSNFESGETSISDIPPSPPKHTSHFYGSAFKPRPANAGSSGPFTLSLVPSQTKKSLKAFSNQVLTTIGRRHTFTQSDSGSTKYHEKYRKSTNDNDIIPTTFMSNGESTSKNSLKFADTNYNNLERTKNDDSETEIYYNSTAASHPDPEPVQIIDIPIRDHLQTRTDADSLIFHRESLEEILSRVGRRPVALLSIAGPSRQGKSFILGYMLRYLKSLSKLNNNSHSVSDTDSNSDTDSDSDSYDSDWMGKSECKKAEPLKGGFVWRSGVERETTGIWMWPQPFTLKRKDGFEFDVLLMDTQGVFDDYTDKKDWATIVGLSLLTSSCLIFNIMNNLQEDSLITLKDFMDFGLLAKAPGSKNKDNVEEKPFQKLLFLIRDWNSPDDFPFGVKGGADFLNRNLERRNTESGTQIRSQIKQCFQQLDCFLMPEPGARVRRKIYNGSVEGMDPEFAENIEMFIEHLFDPSTFPPKLISGNLVTGDDLLLFFEQYVKIFNSDQMPSPHDMNLANALICNQTILNKCVAIYEHTFQENRKKLEKLFLLDSQLEDIHESAQNLSMEHFQNSGKMGSQEDIDKLKTSLLQRIDEMYKLAFAENSKMQHEIIQMASQKLEEHFRDLMMDKISDSYVGPDDFVAEDIFESVYQQSRTESISYFEELLQLDSLDLLPAASQILQNTLQSLKEPMQLQNQMRKTEAENRLKDEIVKLSLQYKNQIEAKLQTFKYWAQTHIQKEETPAREAAFTQFSNFFKDSSLVFEGRKLLTQSIQKEFENIHKLIDLQNKNFLMSINFLISELTNNYTSKMEESAQNNFQLGTTHTEERGLCSQTLLETQDFDRLVPQEAENFTQDLFSRIDKTCKLIVDKWFPRIRQRLIKNYKDKINMFYGNGFKIFDKRELQAEHESLKSNILEKFKNFNGNLPVPVFQDSPFVSSTLSPAKILQDFEAELDNHMETIYEKNLLRAEAVEATLKGFLSKAKNLYLELAREVNEACYPSEEFNTRSSDAKEKALRYFKEECDTNLEESLPLEPSFLNLKNFMQNVPNFKRVGDSSIEISGTIIRFSRELATLDNILLSYNGPLHEIRWRATVETHIDENLCGEFWSGMNLSISTKKLLVVGNERLIICNGESGKSATGTPPPTPTQPGCNGLNGADGFPGESGGNIVIKAEEILHAGNLRVITNGGPGGNGQPGGNGSNGADGIGGDLRFQTSIEELEKNFPSPAKFLDTQVQQNLRKGLQSLKDIAESNESSIIDYKCVNSWSKCLSVETREGAVFRYGFFQGGLKGLVNGRSFYIWFQGAPGVLGQRGGCGGKGGTGGQPGNPGRVEVPSRYGKDVIISRMPGAPGENGREGLVGKSGNDGIQGVDYAIVDPYAGFYVPSNFISKKKFRGRLEMVVGVKSGKNEAAYCPHEKKYISFVNSISMREGVKMFEDPINSSQLPMELITATRNTNTTETEDFASKTSVVSLSSSVMAGAEDNDADDEYLYSCDEYDPNEAQTKIKRKPVPKPKPKTLSSPIIGNAGGFYVRESELRSCIENDDLEASVIDTYATILSQMYPNDQIACLPSTAINFSSNTWKYTPQYINGLAENIKSKSNSWKNLAILVTVVRIDKHWILFAANCIAGEIGIANVIGSHFHSSFGGNGSVIERVVMVLIRILENISIRRNWETRYIPTIAKQVYAHSSGPAALYFLEQLYQKSEVYCRDGKDYQVYREVIIERILQTTDAGRRILSSQNNIEYIEV